MGDYPDNRGPGQPPKYPVKTLAIGESVVFSGVAADKVGTAVRHHKTMKFRCRTFIKGSVPNTRVTRIA